MFDREWWEILIWVIIIIAIIWAIVKEVQVRNCYDGLEQCGHRWEWEPSPDDTNEDLIQKIYYGNTADREIVTRRLVMIMAFILTFVMFWYFTRKPVPPILDFIIVAIIIAAIVWFGFRFHESHYLYPITVRTGESIEALKYNILKN